jgi:hypothetical protein
MMSNLSTIKYRPTSGEQNKFDYLITIFYNIVITRSLKFFANAESVSMNAHLSSPHRTALVDVRYVVNFFFYYLR